MMASVTRLQCLALLVCILQSLSGRVKSEAMFISHVPEVDDDLGYIDTYDPDSIHDSIVKLPGRYSPKLSYGPPATDANGILRNSRFHPSSDRTNVSPRRQNSGGSRRGYDKSIYASEVQNVEPRLAPLRSRPGGNSPTVVNAGPSPTAESDRDHWHSRGNQRTTDLRMTDTRDEEESHTVAPGKKEEPSTSFDRSLPRNVNATLGSETELPCRVLNYNGQSVLWIRRKNLQIIAAGEYRYTTDVRFSISVDKENKEWLLKIKNVTYEDAGVYECQVATVPMLTFAVYLNVVARSSFHHPAAHVESVTMSDESDHSSADPEVKAMILDGREIFVPAHTPIRLTCAVEHPSARPVTVRWFHGSQRLYPSYNRHSVRSTRLSEADFFPRQKLYSLREVKRYANNHHFVYNRQMLTRRRYPLDDNYHFSGNEHVARGPHLRDNLELATAAPYSPSGGRYPFEIDAPGRRNPASNLRPARSPQHSADEYSRSRDYLPDSHSTSSERYPAQDSSVIINNPKFYSSNNELDREYHLESRRTSEVNSKNNERRISHALYNGDAQTSLEGQLLEKNDAFQATHDSEEALINTTFSLTVGLATFHTAGTYTCSPTDGVNATTFIHVFSPDERIQFDQLQIPEAAAAAHLCAGVPCWALEVTAVLLLQRRYF